MRILGLTGSIACGKSHVSSVLRALGATVIDGDAIAHRLTEAGGSALPALRQAFGDAVFLPDGTLNRHLLGQRVFGDVRALAQLDAIMQPLIYQDIQRQLEAARHQACPVCVLDMPLLYEKGLDTLCDSVWCVYLPREQQLSRLMERDHCTQEEAEHRMASQLSTEEKARRANVVIDTSGSMAQTSAQIPPLWAEEVRKATRH